jgi:hypothetical protein
MAGVGHTLPVSRSALIGRRLSAATYGLCLERQNPDIAIARPQGRSRPPIAREDGRRRPLASMLVISIILEAAVAIIAILAARKGKPYI